MILALDDPPLDGTRSRGRGPARGGGCLPTRRASAVLGAGSWRGGSRDAPGARSPSAWRSRGRRSPPHGRLAIELVGVAAVVRRGRRARVEAARLLESDRTLAVLAPRLRVELGTCGRRISSELQHVDDCETSRAQTVRAGKGRSRERRFQLGVIGRRLHRPSRRVSRARRAASAARLLARACGPLGAASPAGSAASSGKTDSSASPASRRSNWSLSIVSRSIRIAESLCSSSMCSRSTRVRRVVRLLDHAADLVVDLAARSRPSSRARSPCRGRGTAGRGCGRARAGRASRSCRSA